MEYFRARVPVSAVICGFLIIALAGCGKDGKNNGGTSVYPAEISVKEPAKKETPPVISTRPITEERIYYDFEAGFSGWEIPVWAQGKSDYAAKEIGLSEEVASQGKNSMKISASFPGGKWSAALVEIQQYLNLGAYRVISVDLYVPKEAPTGLKAKLILTVGSNWKFVEMSRSVPLIPGEWVTVIANIEPGSHDWKRVVPDEEFARDVRKIAVRIESNRKPVYAGPVYIDNVRGGK
ncbi:MAG: hypothetical protein ABIH74_02245 [Candidatus Omnitrophota bacterium]